MLPSFFKFFLLLCHFNSTYVLFSNLYYLYFSFTSKTKSPYYCLSPSLHKCHMLCLHELYLVNTIENFVKLAFLFPTTDYCLGKDAQYPSTVSSIQKIIRFCIGLSKTNYSFDQILKQHCTFNNYFEMIKWNKALINEIRTSHTN